MRLICSRVHFFEINDQPWFPQYLREKVQSCLTLCWTFRVPILQKVSPAQLVSHTLLRTLADRVTNYTYVDFCAGAGGPTPFIEKDLNAKLCSPVTSYSIPPNTKAEHLARRSPMPITPDISAVKFILTDLHPHIPEWTEASKRTDNLSFVCEPVDASNAPADLSGQNGKKIFRLYNLAFHHFDNDLGKAILRNTIETTDGFGFVTYLPYFISHAYDSQYIRTPGKDDFFLHHGVRPTHTDALNDSFLFLEITRSSIFHIHNSNHTVRSALRRNRLLVKNKKCRGGAGHDDRVRCILRGLVCQTRP
jgi:hypothetical protein